MCPDKRRHTSWQVKPVNVDFLRRGLERHFRRVALTVPPSSKRFHFSISLLNEPPVPGLNWTQGRDPQGGDSDLGTGSHVKQKLRRPGDEPSGFAAPPPPARGALRQTLRGSTPRVPPLKTKPTNETTARVFPAAQSPILGCGRHSPPLTAHIADRRAYC